MKAKDQASKLPLSPGCYLMKDKDDKVIYVGKAKNLKKRVTSYFLSGRDLKTSALVDKIENIDYIITGNEYEALVLENNLIKKYNPHYNILLKDGKSYPMIKITNEDFPVVYKTRRILPDKALYFGPYTATGALDSYLKLIKEMYPLRLCKGKLKKQQKPCLYYSINKCSAPCLNKISKEKYSHYIDEIKVFLNKDSTKVIEKLNKQMLEASKNLNFELAAKKRDLINSLITIQTEQAVETNTLDNRDYAALASRGSLCTVSIMQLRDGKLIGKALYRAESLGDENETLLSFLVQYYSDGDSLPDELYLSHEFDYELLENYFSNELKVKLKVSYPQNGKHYRILRMAEVNASEDVEKRMCQVNNIPNLELLKEYISLNRVPLHIEGFDIAQLAGKYTVSSCIVFKNGLPSVKDYRRFNIKSLEGKIDDFESMREVISRRYTRVLNEKGKLPDLIMVDGGKGQVNAAKEMLELLDVDIPIVGLAEKNEEIVFSDDRENLVLDKADPALRILISLRDECHRFATSQNQRMRSKEASFALLESIDGVGKERSKKIMASCSSVEEIIKLSAEDLAKKANIPLNVSKRIIHKLTL